MNLPLATDSSYQEYEELLDVAIDRIRAYDAEFLVISLGFDTFELDPLGKFKISVEDYETIARKVRKGLMHAKGGKGGIEKCLILLEGGYVVERLGECLMSWLRGWEEC